jgi:hypothetical protein
MDIGVRHDTEGFIERQIEQFVEDQHLCKLRIVLGGSNHVIHLARD